jgi:hypothetical protein
VQSRRPTSLRLFISTDEPLFHYRGGIRLKDTIKPTNKNRGRYLEVSLLLRQVIVTSQLEIVMSCKAPFFKCYPIRAAGRHSLFAYIVAPTKLIWITFGSN